jgi:flagellar basal-body rod protein FlgC
MFGSLDIATSGMVAQRTRLEVITANIVNANTLRDAQGRLNPYRRRVVQFAPGDPSATNPFAQQLGVHVRAIELDPTPPQPKEYDPDSPDAYPDGPYKGYVASTNVSSTIEQINALEATRAYEANVVAAEASKQMVNQALRLIA